MKTKTLIRFAALLISAFVLIGALKMWRRHQIEEAKAFCFKLVPQLDEYRQQTGKYPGSLEAILLGSDNVPYMAKGGRGSYGQVCGYVVPTDPADVRYSMILSSECIFCLFAPFYLLDSERKEWALTPFD